MSTLTKEKMLYHTVLRESFMAFCEQCFYLLHKEKLIVNYHHKLLASELEDCRLGKTNNLVINMPPRELKSEITSIFYPIWLLARSEKQLSILIFTRSKKLGKLFLYHIASLLQNELIKLTFPNLRLVSDHYDRLETTKGRITISSPNIPIIGMGGDIIIIDDPITVAEANDIEKVRALNTWFDSELLSRLNNKSEAKIILLMQRLHRFDLSSYMLLIKKDNVRHLNLEALATSDINYAWQEWSVLARRFIDKSYQRNKGKILNEARDNLAIMKKLQTQLGESTFEAQYQQNPKLDSYEDILCKTSYERTELIVKDALLCISLNIKGNKVKFLSSLQEKKSDKTTLIDYKIESFTNLQTTLNTYVEQLLKTINTSHSINHRFSRLHVVIVLTQSNYKLTLDELNKFRKDQFRYQFVLFNNKKLTKFYKVFKNTLYKSDWQSGMVLSINDNSIKKELRHSLESKSIDDFFKLVCLSFIVHHNY